MCIQDYRIAERTEARYHADTITATNTAGLVGGSGGRVALVVAIGGPFDAVTDNGFQVGTINGNIFFPLVVLNQYRPSALLLFTEYGQILRGAIQAKNTMANDQNVLVTDIRAVVNPEDAVTQKGG